jgi:hypothetical protein
VALSAAATLFTANPSQAAAQNKARQEESHPLSAAIEKAKQSPFHTRSEASALLFSPTRIGFSSSAGLTAPRTGDDTPSVGDVFLASWISATASDFAGILLLSQAYSGDSFGAGLAVLAAAPVSVLGGAIGAKLVGAPYGRATMGSLAGVAVGIAMAVMSGGFENHLSFLFFSAVHAGAITMSVAG